MRTFTCTAGEIDAQCLGETVSFDWVWPNSKVRAHVTGFVATVVHDTHGTTLELLGEDGTTNESFTLPHSGSVDVNPE